MGVRKIFGSTLHSPTGVSEQKMVGVYHNQLGVVNNDKDKGVSHALPRSLCAKVGKSWGSEKIVGSIAGKWWVPIEPIYVLLIELE